METFFERIVTKAGRIVRHWWMLLVTGLLLVAGGIVVFCNPVESYLTLSVMFGVLMYMRSPAGNYAMLLSRNDSCSASCNAWSIYALP